MTRRGPAHAFSLVELLAVLVILGLTIAMVRISTTGLTQRQRLEASARRVADTVALASDRASIEYRFYQVLYDLGRRRLEIRSLAGGTADGRLSLALPAGLQSVEVQEESPAAGEDGQTTSPDTVSILVRPDGTVQAHEVLFGLGGHTYSVRFTDGNEVQFGRASEQGPAS